MLSLLGIPTIISSALTFLSPVMSAVVKFGSWYLSEMWDGLKTIFSNLSTFLVIGTIAVISILYGTSIAECATVLPDTLESVKPWEFDFGIR